MLVLVVKLRYHLHIKEIQTTTTTTTATSDYFHCQFSLISNLLDVENYDNFTGVYSSKGVLELLIVSDKCTQT